MPAPVARRRSYAVAAASVSPDPYASAVKADGPAVYYKLADATTTAVDEMGLQAGTYSGTVTQAQPSIRPGGLGQSCLFGGGQVNIPDNVGLRPGGAGNPFTLESWVKPGASIAAWATWIDTATAGRAISIWFQTLQIVYEGWHGPLTMSSALATSTAVHFAVVADATSCRVYVNGALVGTDASGQPLGSPVSVALAIGYPLSGGNQPFLGNLQDFAIYKKALTQPQIQAHYAAG